MDNNINNNSNYGKLMFDELKPKNGIAYNCQNIEIVIFLEHKGNFQFNICL